MHYIVFICIQWYTYQNIVQCRCELLRNIQKDIRIYNYEQIQHTPEFV